MAIYKQYLPLLTLALLPLIAPSADAQLKTAASADYDRDAALSHSQAAIGRRLGNHRLTNTSGNPVRISDYAGKPLLISLVFTSCDYTCPVTTRRLKKAVEAASEVLDADSFHVVTIGFDHITQVTVIDRDGMIYRQVYGEMFELPWLVEPLKELVFNRPQSAGHLVAGLFDRIRLFCTVYNPNTGRYEFDYSIFIQTAIGLMVLLSVFAYLLREYLQARRK